MIPSCLNLTTEQEEKFCRFLEFLRNGPARKYHNEDASMASPVTFEIYATGIGDNIIAKGFGYFCILTIDDDGEIINDGDIWYQNLEKKP